MSISFVLSKPRSYEINCCLFRPNARNSAIRVYQTISHYQRRFITTCWLQARAEGDRRRQQRGGGGGGGGGQARCHTASKGSNEIAVDLLGNVILSIITILQPAINQSNIRECSFYHKENNTS